MAMPFPRRVPRRALGILASLLLGVLVVAGFAGTAHAADGYKYWNYFHLEKGAWTFATKGAGQVQPADGAVEGFRYGTSTMSQSLEPRADLSQVDFAAICTGEKAPAGQKRVAVVLDYGTDEGVGSPPDPRAACATVPQDATTQQVLEESAQTRVEGGMVCGIDGYPAKGCGEPVKDATVPSDEQPVDFAMPTTDGTDSDAASSQDAGGGSMWPLVGVAAAVVVIGGAALTLGRRGRSTA